MIPQVDADRNYRTVIMEYQPAICLTALVTSIITISHNLFPKFQEIFQIEDHCNQMLRYYVPLSRPGVYIDPNVTLCPLDLDGSMKKAEMWNLMIATAVLVVSALSAFFIGRLSHSNYHNFYEIEKRLTNQIEQEAKMGGSHLTPIEKELRINGSLIKNGYFFDSNHWITYTFSIITLAYYTSIILEVFETSHHNDNYFKDCGTFVKNDFAGFRDRANNITEGSGDLMLSTLTENVCRTYRYHQYSPVIMYTGFIQAFIAGVFSHRIT